MEVLEGSPRTRVYFPLRLLTPTNGQTSEGSEGHLALRLFPAVLRAPRRIVKKDLSKYGSKQLTVCVYLPTPAADMKQHQLCLTVTLSSTSRTDPEKLVFS